MSVHEKGFACHVLPHERGGSTVVAMGELAALNQVKEVLRTRGCEVTTERHGPLAILLTDAAPESLPGILLDHFEMFYRYEKQGFDQVKVTDADGVVEIDGDEEGEGDLL